MIRILDTSTPPNAESQARLALADYGAQGWAAYVGGPGAYVPAVTAWRPLLGMYFAAFPVLPVYVCRQDSYGVDDLPDAIALLKDLPRKTVCLDLEPFDRTGGYQTYVNQLVSGLRGIGKRVVLYSWPDVLTKCALIPNPPDVIWAAAPGATMADVAVPATYRLRVAVQYGQVGKGRFDISEVDQVFLNNMKAVGPPPPAGPDAHQLHLQHEIELHALHVLHETQLHALHLLHEQHQDNQPPARPPLP